MMSVCVSVGVFVCKPAYQNERREAHRKLYNTEEDNTALFPRGVYV